MLILQLVRLDVLPERRYDDRPAERIVLMMLIEHNVFTISNPQHGSVNNIGKISRYLV